MERRQLGELHRRRSRRSDRQFSASLPALAAYQGSPRRTDGQLSVGVTPASVSIYRRLDVELNVHLVRHFFPYIEGRARPRSYREWSSRGGGWLWPHRLYRRREQRGRANRADGVKRTR